jgi:hypothetical protein
MSTSSPVRTRQRRRPSTPPQAGSNRSPRGEAAAVVARSILLAVAAVSVLATSNYFAYLIGRRQATYEELNRQVDRVVHLMNQNQVEEQPAPVTVKQQQDRLKQNAPGLTDLTTSTINGKTTVVAPEAAPAERPASAALIDPPRETSAPATKPRAMHGVANQRSVRRQKVPRAAPAEALAQQPAQSTTATPATPDIGAGNQ